MSAMQVEPTPQRYFENRIKFSYASMNKLIVTSNTSIEQVQVTDSYLWSHIR